MGVPKSQSRGPLARRRRALFLPPLTLDRHSTLPLYIQIRKQIAEAVTRGGHAGTRLPSTRMLARMLDVSRNTVVTAYEELAAEGVIEGRLGSGMVVAVRPRGPVTGFDPLRLLREAQYPGRTVAFEDADGTSLYLIY